MSTDLTCKYICIDCGQDETENSEGDWTGQRWVQLPRECPECGGFIEWQKHRDALPSALAFVWPMSGGGE